MEVAQSDEDLSWLDQAQTSCMLRDLLIVEGVAVGRPPSSVMLLRLPPG